MKRLCMQLAFNVLIWGAPPPPPISAIAIRDYPRLYWSPALAIHKEIALLA